ncbi:2,4-dienoyl-CoA reductase [Oceanobacillus kapialis]|uniref:2,4-dienoyl-CoA reductase n=1 Tax=Oceanobacillus kapialis TaxID=481353 RepID=A0ABW5PXW4_9BACI
MLDGQTVLITGSTSGMGKQMAAKFAKEGLNVVITGRDSEKLKAVKLELQNSVGGSIFAAQLDVRDPDSVKKVVEESIAHFGEIHHLVNNAAGNFIVPAEDLSVNGWNAVINIVLNGTFYCSREVGNYWIEKKIKGSIINMVATYAWNAGAGVVHSSAAKAGVLNMTRTLAVEWGTKYGIRVNAIAPGPIERTGGADKLFESEEAAKRTIQSVPLGRLGKPEEIAELAYFMLSDKAAYMNGEVITLDGGQWLNKFPF